MFLASPRTARSQIEYHLVHINSETGECAIALVAPEVVADLEEDDRKHTYTIASAWRPEYGAWMVEATPGIPYGGSTHDLLSVERNMAMRRYRISGSKALPPGTLPFSLVNFPLLGAGRFFTLPPRAPGGAFSRSAYLPDAVISPHPRFGALTANIRRRRGRKVNIQVPLYMDRRSGRTGVLDAVTSLESEPRLAAGSLAPSTVAAALAGGCEGCSAVERFDEVQAESAAATADDSVGSDYVPVPGYVHMDAMGFGMGCCCLQVTFQARDMAESRFLYDQLAVLAPLMLALTANAPIWRGRLVETDTRWGVLSASVDCRTPTERGDASEPTPAWMASEAAEGSAGCGRRPIAKSRYSSIDAYIAQHPALDDLVVRPGGPAVRGEEVYNDIALGYDEEAVKTLLAAGLDERLSRHVAHLFIRDPLVVFTERTDAVDDATSTEHFENIQSTNWRSVRWKPPPPDESASGAHSIGWRVELRSMEVQATDFENAAYTVFVVLLSRVILFFDLSLYIPLSLVDANFARADEREAASRGRFWFRTRLTPLALHCEPCAAAAVPTTEPLWSEMSLVDILVGRRVCEDGATAAAGGEEPGSGSAATPSPASGSAASFLSGREFPGLIPLIYVYLGFIGCDAGTREVIDGYLRLIVGRARGDIMTGATWQRKVVRAHPEYAGDGVVTPRIATDLLAAVRDVVAGVRSAPELLGGHAPPPFVFTGSEPEVSPQPAPGPANAAVGGDGGVPLTVTAPFPTSRMRGSSFGDGISDSAWACKEIADLIQVHAARLGVEASSLRERGGRSFSNLASPVLGGLRGPLTPADFDFGL